MICLLLVAATLIVYAQTAHFSFVGFDDNLYVTENKQVQAGVTAGGIRWAFTSGYASNWHPATWLSHMVDYQLFALAPAGHHVTNVLLHIVNTLLLFAVFRRMTGTTWPSALAAALFALHPLHVESVAWVSERKDVLSTFFALLSIWAYFAYATDRGRKWLWLSAALLAAGLMVKPMLVTLPLVLLLLDYWPLSRMRSGKAALALVWEKIPLLAVCAASSVVTMLVQQAGGSVSQLEAAPLPARMANAAVSYVRYMHKTFWPTELGVLYTHPDAPGGIPWAFWQISAATALLATITLLIFFNRRRHPYALVGWLWFLGTLVPVIGLVQVGRQAMADRYSYLPLIGFFMVIAWGAAELVKIKALQSSAARCTVAGAMIAALAGCMMLSGIQTGYWRNSTALFDHALEISPTNPIIHNNYGVALCVEDQVEPGMDHFGKALAVDPTFYLAHYNLGNAHRTLGNPQRAVRAYRRALRFKRDANTHLNLAVTLAEIDKLDEAIDEYNQALALKPNWAQAHNNLGFAYGTQGKYDLSVKHLRRAVAIQPQFAEAHLNLANALAAVAKHDEALEHYLTAVQQDPQSSQAQYRTGSALLDRGHRDGAVKHFRKAVQLDPDFAAAHSDLALALGSGGEFEAAIDHFQKSLALEPDSAFCQYNLAVTMTLVGQLGESLPHYRRAAELEPSWPGPWRGVAWVLATHPDAAVRDGQKAIEAAQRAVQLCRHGDPQVLDALAAAQAEAGQYEQAVSTAQAAITLATAASDQKLVSDISTRLTLYESQRPYRAPARTRLSIGQAR